MSVYDKVYWEELEKYCSPQIDVLKNLEEKLDMQDKDLTSEERNLFEHTYHYIIMIIKEEFATIRKRVKRQRQYEYNSELVSYFKEYRKKLQEKIIGFNKEMIKKIDEKFLKKAEDIEAKVCYTKMKAESYEYIAEYAEGDYKKEVIDDGLKAYEEATTLAEELPIFNSEREDLSKDFALFYADTMNDLAKAIELAKNDVEKFEKEMAKFDDNEKKKYKNFYNFHKDKIPRWTSYKSREEIINAYSGK